MGFIVLLLLGIFIYYVVWPIVRVALTLRRARRQARDFFNDASGRSGAQGQRESSAYREYRRARRRGGKKIDASVGEYVEFEEIPTYRSADTGQATRPDFKPESQVEDAEWVDL